MPSHTGRLLTSCAKLLLSTAFIAVLSNFSPSPVSGLVKIFTFLLCCVQLSSKLTIAWLLRNSGITISQLRYHVGGLDLVTSPDQCVSDSVQT